MSCLAYFNSTPGVVI